MKYILLSASILAILFQNTWAARPPKPEKCPDVSAIQSVGILDVGRKFSDWIAGVRANSYGTKETWTFMTPAIKATDEHEATIKALSILSSMKLLLPEPVEFINESWLCYYYSHATASGGGATTPAKWPADPSEIKF